MEEPFVVYLNFEEMAKFQEIAKSLRNGGSSKVDAVKLVRDARHHQIIREDGTRVSTVRLMNAKLAVESWMLDHGLCKLEDLHHGAPGGQFIPGRARIETIQPIKRIVIDMGNGEMEVDMAGMSLQFLLPMNKIPFEHLAALVDLYKRVDDWQKQFTS
jgi:hypothetical protein